MPIGALVAHDADGTDVGKHGEGLPYLAFEAGSLHLFPDDRVGVLQHRDLVAGDLADDADTKSRTGERLTPDDLVGKTEFCTNLAHFVLEQRPQGLDEFEVHVVGKTTDVVMALDLGCVLGSGFDDIRVQRSLHEETGVVETDLRILEDTDEEFADRLALFLGIGDAFESIEESIAGADMDQFDSLMTLERLDDLFALALTHQARIDEHAGELRTDGLVNERRSDSGIDTARQPADRTAGADLGTNEFDLRLDDRRHRP